MSISGVISSSNTQKTLLGIAQNQHFTQKQKNFLSFSSSDSNKSRIFVPEFGKVAEWFIATTACRCGPQGPGGSNPSLSARCPAQSFAGLFFFPTDLFLNYKPLSCIFCKDFFKIIAA